MNQRIKRLWLEALTSGRYEQGRYELRDTDNKFCCLGVLCDIHKEQTEEGRWIKRHIVEFHLEEDVVVYDVAEDSYENHLPLSVCGWSNIERDYTKILASLNDGGSTFTEIAQKIEEDFPSKSELEVPLHLTEGVLV